MINNGIRYRLRIVIACIMYILANAFDYFMTVEGITMGRNTEGNPIIQLYINRLGLYQGLLLYKSLMCILIIIGTVALDYAYIRKAKNPKPLRLSLCLLYFGAFVTFLGGLSWW